MKSFMYVLNFHLEICSCLQPALSLFFNNFNLLMSKPSSSLLRNLIIHLPTSKCSPELRENKTKRHFTDNNQHPQYCPLIKQYLECFCEGTTMYQLIVARRNLIILEVKLRGRKLKKIKSASPGLQLYQVSIAVYRYMLLFYHMHAYTLCFFFL